MLQRLFHLDNSSSRALVPYDGGREMAPYVDAEVIRIDGAGLRQADQAPAVFVETRTPARAPSIESDALVPGIQTVFAAAAVAIGAGALCWALGWSWRVVAVAAALTLGGGWVLHYRAVRDTLWEVTTEQGTAPATVVPQRSNYLVANPAVARQQVARETRQQDQDQAHHELLQFLDRCYICGTGERSHGVKASGPDRDAYVQRRDVLLSLGIAKWRNPARPRAGWVMAVSRMRARQLLEKHLL